MQMLLVGASSRRGILDQRTEVSIKISPVVVKKSRVKVRVFPDMHLFDVLAASWLTTRTQVRPAPENITTSTQHIRAISACIDSWLISVVTGSSCFKLNPSAGEYTQWLSRLKGLKLKDFKMWMLNYSLLWLDLKVSWSSQESWIQ